MCVFEEIAKSGVGIVVGKAQASASVIKIRAKETVGVAHALHRGVEKCYNSICAIKNVLVYCAFGRDLKGQFHVD